MKLKIKASLGKGLTWSNARNVGNLKVESTLTMGHLMFQIRLSLATLDEADALYLFIDNQVLVCNSDLLLTVFQKYAVNGVLPITVIKESTFGTLESRFVSAEILEISPQAFKLSISYSYYNLYGYTTVFVYKTQQECLNRLVLERCSGHLLIKKSNGDEVKIDPGDG
jgi:hypothetical protein